MEDESPVPFIDSIKSITSGQVYSVLILDDEGRLSKLTKSKDERCTFAERVSNQLTDKTVASHQSCDDGYLFYVIT